MKERRNKDLTIHTHGNQKYVRTWGRGNPQSDYSSNSIACLTGWNTLLRDHFLNHSRSQHEESQKQLLENHHCIFHIERHFLSQNVTNIVEDTQYTSCPYLKQSIIKWFLRHRIVFVSCKHGYATMLYCRVPQCKSFIHPIYIYKICKPNM